MGNHAFNCWRKHGHGAVNLHKALVESCDVYFYTLGKKLGIDRIAKWAHRFGLGQPSGLNLEKEAPGLVASTDWKKARFHQPWHEGETMSVAIGQGYNLATPIQMAQVVAAIANGGILYEPQIVDKVESPSGEVLFQSQPVVKSRLEASPATLAAVQRGLEGVVEEEKGTGRDARAPQYPGGRQDRHRPGGGRRKAGSGKGGRQTSPDGQPIRKPRLVCGLRPGGQPPGGRGGAGGARRPWRLRRRSPGPTGHRRGPSARQPQVAKSE